jgi:hypothetical protein
MINMRFSLFQIIIIGHHPKQTMTCEQKIAPDIQYVNFKDIGAGG